MSEPFLAFADLVAQDCFFDSPVTPEAVVAALNAYGVSFQKRGKNPEILATRLDLLFGIAWLHSRHDSLETDLARLSAEQQAYLAAALGLDFATQSLLPSWPLLVARRVLSKVLPGGTPTQRPRPESPGGHGQIVKPGGAPPPADDPPAAPPGAKPNKPRQIVNLATPSPGHSDSPSSGDDDAAATGAGGGAPRLALMPPAILTTAAFRQLVSARCAEPWEPTVKIESAIPPSLRAAMCRARLWPTKQRNEYEKMIVRQQDRGNTGVRRENPTDPAFVHRIFFDYSGDESLAADGALLALVCVCERPSDFVGPSGRALGGSAAREDSNTITRDMRTSWDSVCHSASVPRSPGPSVVYNLVATVHSMMERRYARLASLLAAADAAVREEVLANSARQCLELIVYTDALREDLASRASNLAYEQLATF
jgi:hypothetical protein